MKNLIFFSISLLLLVCACSRGDKGGPISDMLNSLGSEKNSFDDKKKYFTSGTVSVIERAASSGAISKEERILLLPFFSERIKWTVTEQKIEGDSATVRIKFTEHPVENVKGFEMELRMIKSGGAWKIDLEREIKERFR